MKAWPVQDAKSRFGEMLAACEREGPQLVTEDGVEAAVLVPFAEWRRFNQNPPLDLKDLLLSDVARYDEIVPKERGVARHGEPLEF